ncbi:MAG TPA: hypothetical protein VD813_03830, partial [Pseudonocardia sp.]|nr:hypothetical protein [Pseudonocardia sp.]
MRATGHEGTHGSAVASVHLPAPWRSRPAPGNRLPENDPLPACGPCGAGEGPEIPEIVTHLGLALSRHVHRMHQEGLAVPREVENLAVFLMRLARVRQSPPVPADATAASHHSPMPD